MEIQNIPVVDSPNNDAFEAIVEVYYQMRGYITSAGKWFWVYDENKKQRGYQDIDVLAINGEETIIISVSSNLDDKVNTKNNEKLQKLIQHFERIERYLESVPQYNWMVSDTRKIKRVVACANIFKRTHEKIEIELKNVSIEIVSSDEMFSELSKYAGQKNIKIQNQMLRTIQLYGSATPIQ